ncbi:MAG TPA: SH3 domain-containing protein [Candidatus Limiplasma sp.]|nr:SH3 domain-containing protein [Candidatus Limiplasma sp.]
MKVFVSEKCLAVAAIIAAILFALPLLSLAMAEEAQPTQMYVMNVTSWLNGRTSPDTASDVEARFQCGDEVAVYEVSGQWAKVAGGESGYVWCSVAYLSSTPPDSDPQTCTVRSNGRVRVRDNPDGELVRWLEDGDTVQVQSWFMGWAYIGDGYVDKQYLQEASE